MLTKRDIELLEGIFATKEDLKGFATKEDLKGFATKEDLKGFATKEDLKGFATKEDLKGFATKEDLNIIKMLIIDFKDAILKEIKDMRDELALVTGYKDQIEDHETRIEKLEKHTSLTPTS